MSTFLKGVSGSATECYNHSQHRSVHRFSESICMPNILYASQTFYMQAKHSICMPNILYACQTFYMQAKHSICMPNILYACQTFYMRAKHSICKPNILHASQTFYIRAKHSICKPNILYACQTFYKRAKHSIKSKLSEQAPSTLRGKPNTVVFHTVYQILDMLTLFTFISFLKTLS